MRIRGTALLALCGVAAVTAATGGCGSSSTLSKAELARKADAICLQTRRTADERLGAIPATMPSIAAYDRGILGVAAPADREIAKLGPPASEKKAWQAYLAARKRNTVETRQEEAIADSDDQRALQRFSVGRQRDNQARAKLASQLGLKVCGRQGDVPNVLGPPQPSAAPPNSVHFVKPRDTVDQAIAALRSAKTCADLRALQNSDDAKFPAAVCKQLLGGLAGFRPIAKDDLGAAGVVDFSAKGGLGTALFVLDAKDGRLKLSNAFGFEAGAVHKPRSPGQAVSNMQAALAAARSNDGAAFHRVVSESSSFYAKPSKTVTLPSPTGSGARLLADVRADRAAKPQTLGVDLLFGVFWLKANGHNYTLFNVNGPTGYKWVGFYPAPAG